LSKKGFIGESPNVWLKFSLEGNDGPEKETKHSHCVVRKGSLENPQVFGSSFLLKEMMGPRKRQTLSGPSICPEMEVNQLY
jgi:hypothetical protein